MKRVPMLLYILLIVFPAVSGEPIKFVLAEGRVIGTDSMPVAGVIVRNFAFPFLENTLKKYIEPSMSDTTDSAGKFCLQTLIDTNTLTGIKSQKSGLFHRSDLENMIFDFRNGLLRISNCGSNPGIKVTAFDLYGRGRAIKRFSLDRRTNDLWYRIPAGASTAVNLVHVSGPGFSKTLAIIPGFATTAKLNREISQSHSTIGSQLYWADDSIFSPGSVDTLEFKKNGYSTFYRQYKVFPLPAVLNPTIHRLDEPKDKRLLGQWINSTTFKLNNSMDSSKSYSQGRCLSLTDTSWMLYSYNTFAILYKIDPPGKYWRTSTDTLWLYRDGNGPDRSDCSEKYLFSIDAHALSLKDINNSIQSTEILYNYNQN